MVKPRVTRNVNVNQIVWKDECIQYIQDILNGPRTIPTRLTDEECIRISAVILAFYIQEVPGDLVDAICLAAHLVKGAPRPELMSRRAKFLWCLRIGGLPRKLWRAVYKQHFSQVPSALGHANENAGAKSVKWHAYQRRNGDCVRVQGAYELRMCQILDRDGVKWKTHPKIRLPYYDEKDQERTYGPDFYLPEHSCYLETKGFYPPGAQFKMRSVAAWNPDVSVRLVFLHDLERLEAGMTISDWLAAQDIG